ncbi:hypothetical protein SAMN04489724_3044 [Algoriphagus locisalis]|uniref:Uncharacterized protein n=1 Tax=Algoriphagus locisalis TaxID=305507 RepID=A0A1I7CBQ4_9BACT|nr:hypothetical protein [Algoriphagus locisalis]SFT96850.1 hypothetical protein SAMN04489724_3044 [Algoriphagus locisalis]
MKKRITLLAIAFNFSALSFHLMGQTTTFDYMNSNVGSQKTISWNTSIYGSGFGHRLISIDPGGATTLNLQARHNSATWKDAIVINSQGYVGFGLNPSTYPFHFKFASANRARFEFITNTIDLVSYAPSTNDYGNSAGVFMSGQDGLIMTGQGNNLRFITNNGSYLERMRILPNGNVGINTKNPAYTLSVNGIIGAQEVNVTTTGWADYVFKPEYHLMPLSELESFIEKNGHLPNVPTEREVIENGVNLAEMNVKLLEKVEELTLYIIRLEKSLKSQKQDISVLKRKLE